MQGCLRGREIGKREMPLKAIEQQKADLAHFAKFCYSWKTTSKYLHKRNRLLVVFRGAKRSRKSHQIRAFLFERNQWFSMCDTMFTEMGPRSTKKHIRLCRFFARIPGKVENGGPRMLCFAVVFLVFWGTLPPFRSRMGPGPENLNPVRTPGCRFRCFSWKIASRNHQYSLGFNWYFERGDDGNSDSKRTRKHQ